MKNAGSSLHQENAMKDMIEAIQVTEDYPIDDSQRYIPPAHNDHEIAAAAMLHDAESEAIGNAQVILKKSVDAMFEDDCNSSNSLSITERMYALVKGLRAFHLMSL